ncbi:MAG TPA: cupin domain-containing protein [Candidatus Binataceae bacterium]|nr:cupin domain-containing protein [Candidatus Binataceae bacterium]
MRLPKLLPFIAALALIASRPGFLAAASASAEVDHELLRQSLADKPGTDVVIVTAEYPPGAGTPLHEHPGHTYAYVLEGAVASQLEGQPLRTYTVGQMWSEEPHQHHIVCKNASSTAHAKLLVVFVIPHGETLETYLPAK